RCDRISHFPDWRLTLEERSAAHAIHNSISQDAKYRSRRRHATVDGDKQADTATVADWRIHGVPRARARIPQRISHQSELRDSVFAEGRSAPALSYGRGCREDRTRPRGVVLVSATTDAALAPICSGFLPACHRAGARSRRNRQVRLVLPSLRRISARGDL